MYSERFQRLQSIFDAALRQNEEARAHFVEEACGEDREMAEEILALLGHDAQQGDMRTMRPLALAMEAFEAAEAGSLIEQTIGRFQLQAEIASGGMGRVFKARRIDGDVEQTVALKLIRRELFNDALLKRFSDERRILASLSHPGIAHLIDAGTDAHGTPYVAMEYVDGLPLLEYCAAHAPSIRSRVALFRQILSAVSYAHRNLVVHRDLKPANVLVTAEGQVKLLDFGLAKALGADHQQTATAERFFTPAYAAPEQLRGEPAAVACDVYALGAILYELLSGSPAIDLSEISAGEAERRILSVPPEALPIAAAKRGEPILRRQSVDNIARWTKQLAGDLDVIVQKALKKEPEARYISVEQFDEDLVRYQEQRPVRASGAGWWYRTRKFCERNANAMILATVVTIAGFAAIVHIVNQNAIVREERDHARVARDRAQAMLDVLKNAFESANPSRPGEKDYAQTQAMLAAAVRQIDPLEKTQPDLFQLLAYQVGQIQINVGKLADGLDLVRRGNRATTMPPDTGLLLEMQALIKNEKTADARAFADAHRSKLRNYPNFQSQEAHLLQMEGRYPEAIELSERLLAGKSLEELPMLRDDVRFSLMESYAATDQLQRAIGMMDVIVPDRLARYGEGHPLAEMARLRRVQLYFSRDDTMSAERELIAMKPSLERNRDVLSGIPAVYHDLYAQLLIRQERPREAVGHFRQALAAAEANEGPESRNAMAANVHLALSIAENFDDRREAYPHFQRAIAIGEKLDPNAPIIGILRWQAAQSYARDGNFESVGEVLTPTHALRYFEHMPDEVKDGYIDLLRRAFGEMKCGPEWERQAQGKSRKMKVGWTLICARGL